MSIAKPTLVLVHGAWHSVQCFDLLQRELQSRGWTTETPAHVSPGDQSGTVHTADNARIIRQTLQKLCDEGKTIVLVAHSYGGCTASCAVEGLSLRARRASGRAGGVVMFVYLSAFIIPAGTSMTQAFGEKLSTWHKVDDDFVYADSPGERFYHDVEPALREQFVGLLKPEPIRIFDDLITYNPWRDIDCAYIFCDNDQAVSIDVQKKMASLLPAGTLALHIPTSHSPFLSNPKMLADYIETCARPRGQEGEE